MTGPKGKGQGRPLWSRHCPSVCIADVQYYDVNGNAEFAGVDNAGVDNSAPRSKEWTLQEWTNQHDVARVDIAGVDNVAPCGRGDNAGVDLSARCDKGGQCGSGQCRSPQASIRQVEM